jgi:sugar phosphate isomerase/epimerase
MMEVGIFARTYQRPTFEAALDAVVAHGFRHIQFNMASAGLEPLPAKITVAHTKRIQRACKERGIAIKALSGTFNMAHPDESVRTKGLQRLEVLMSVAGELGTNFVTLCTGTRDPNNMWRYHPDNASQQAWNDAMQTIGEAAEIAREYDVRLGIEPEPGNIVSNARKALKLLKELDSPDLAIILDPANIIDGVPEDEIDATIDSAVKRLGYRTLSIHGKDRDASGNVVPAGKGIVPWERFIAGLQRIGNKNPILLHGLDEAEAPGAKAFLERVIAGV